MEISGNQESVAKNLNNKRRASRTRSTDKNPGRRKSQDKAAKKGENDIDKEDHVEEMDKETYLSHCLLVCYSKLF